MAWFTEFTNLSTGESISPLRSASIRYRDDSGHEHETPQHPAWCSQCNMIVTAEGFPSFLTSKRTMLETALADFSSKEAWLFRTPEIARRELEALNLLTAFLIDRVSPPRCLECYSTDIMELPTEEFDQEFTLPDGHTYQQTGFGHASLVSEPTVLLNREGLPVPSLCDDPKPTTDADS